MNEVQRISELNNYKQYFGLQPSKYCVYNLYINQVIPETENGEPCVL